MIRFVLLFFIFDRLTFSSCAENPIVTTPLGSIEGRVNVSRNGIKFYSFTGIPYAEAPIGELRFKPPVPRKPWSGVLKATKTAPSCNPNDIETDCLHLTVYTRRINDDKNNRPVLLLIESGRYFEFGSTVTEATGPDYLMDHDIVLVVFNYRSSIFGFYSTGDKYAPGNYGLKDQVEALRWIKTNIKSFGGDPNRVTICGASGGAASVGLHLLSPMSRGLFHRAMLLSGSPLNFWAFEKNPMKLAKKEAKIQGCPTESSEKMVECMAKIPANERLRTSHHDIFEWRGVGRSHAPVVEVENGGQERFLEKDPILSILAGGDVADVPIFIGTARYEGSMDTLNYLFDRKWSEDISQNWTTILPILCYHEFNDAISNKLREFYFGSLDKPITHSSSDNFTTLIGDARKIYGVAEFTKLISQKITKPIYLYQYNYLGKGFLPHLIEENRDKTANLYFMFYVFHNKFFPTNFSSDTEDGRFVTKMTTLWKNFMETGNPTPGAATELDNVIWEPYTKENPKYLDINETLKMENGIYFQERIEFWEKLLPLLGKF